MKKPEAFRIELVLPGKLRPVIEKMVGKYGSNDSEVVETLVITGLDQVQRSQKQLERKQERKKHQII